MKKLPFFSIIVPVYQSKDFLMKCVANIQQQTFKNIEIILVDDGSTDGSANLCDELAAIDKRIVVIHKQNGGASSARNVGIKNSKGKWIIFVDSDDIVSEVMCENFFKYIKQSKTNDFIACNFAPNKGQLIRTTSYNHIILDLESVEQNENLVNCMLLLDYHNFSLNFRNAFGNNVVLNSPCAKAYSYQFIKRKKILFHTNVKYAEDMLFNIEILINGAKGIYVNDAVYFYNKNFNSATRRNYVPGIIENYVAYKKIVEDIITNNKLYQLQLGLNAYCICSAVWVLPADVFSPNNTIWESKNRFLKVVDSEDFSQLINPKILTETKGVLSKSVLYKCKLMLNKKFWVLALWYKVLVKLKEIL